MELKGTNRLLGQLVSGHHETRTTPAISQASSCFPVQEIVLFIIAPGTVWKPKLRVLANEGTVELIRTQSNCFLCQNLLHTTWIDGSFMSRVWEHLVLKKEVD